VFFRLLSTMVDAGIPLIQSLKTLAEQNRKNPKFFNTLNEMADSIEAGESLSGAMEHYRSIFSEAETGMIRSGEVSGHLNKILRQLAGELEKSAALVSKVKGALTYPVVIIFILFAVLYLMMVMVIPQMSTLFDQAGTKLPTLTQVVISISDFLLNNSIYILGGLAAFFGIFILWTKTKNGKYQWHFLLLKFPLFGSLIEKATLARFSRTFSNLLASGVPIVQSLNIIGNATKNEVYKRKFKLAADDIKSGIPLAETLRNTKYFPTLFVNMLEVGEQTAQLESICVKVADFYEEEVDTTVKSLTKILEPIVIVFVGVAVGGLVAAIMLPIMSLANIAGSV